MSRDLDINIVVHDEQAMPKLAAVDQALEQTAGQAVATADNFGRFEVSAKAADLALSQMHANLKNMPGTFAQVRTGINDVASSAGLTVESLGMMNAAGLVIGTAYAAWGIGRAIADFTGLDGIISKNAASLLGWGNDSAETAGAKADALALATQRSGQAVTQLSVALEINTRWLEEWKVKAQLMADAAQRLKAPEESARAIREWNADLELVRQAGVISSLTKDIDSNNFSVGELAKRYAVSTGAIAFFKAELKSASDDVRKATEYTAEITKRLHDEDQKAASAKSKSDAEELAAAREVLKITRDINKEYDAEITKHEAIVLKLQTEASLAEFQAKRANMAQYGVDEKGAPLGLQNDPMTKAQREVDALKRSATSDPSLRGISTAEREAQIWGTAMRAQADAAKAADELAVSSTQAASAGNQLSAAHSGAVLAVDAMSTSMASFRGVLVGAIDAMSPGQRDRNAPLTVDGGTGMYTGSGVGMIGSKNNLGMAGGPLITAAGRAAGLGFGLQSFDVGGPITKDGPIMAHEGEFIVPKGGALVGGGGVSIGDIHVHGDIASESSARLMADRVAKLVLERVNTQGKSALTKAK